MKYMKILEKTIQIILIIIIVVALICAFIFGYTIFEMKRPYMVVGNYIWMKREIRQLNPKIGEVIIKKSRSLYIIIDISEPMTSNEISEMVDGVKVIILKEKNFKRILKEWESPHYFRGIDIGFSGLNMDMSATDPEWPPYSGAPHDIEKVISWKSVVDNRHRYTAPELKWDIWYSAPIYD